MTAKTYIPFTESFRTESLVVDAITTRGTALSHWKGAPVPAGCEHDTSAGIAINALRTDIPAMKIPLVTANHFDVDGFIGIWSLLNPTLALENEALLKEIAIIGDFREYDPDFPEAEKALALTCWLNSEEKRLFYRPFGSDDEMKDCDEKFRYFLPAFTDVLLHTENYRPQYETEVRQVLYGHELLQESGHILTFPEIGLVVIHAPEPVHYYALFSPTRGFDKVLSIYPGQRYELEYKYRTWVNTWSHTVFPRISMEPLSALLNAAEKTGFRWFADKITDTGPILRLENTDLTKADRFAHPFERDIHSSSISPAELTASVYNFFREKYRDITPKLHWSWDETRVINEMIVHNPEM